MSADYFHSLWCGQIRQHQQLWDEKRSCRCGYESFLEPPYHFNQMLPEIPTVKHGGGSIILSVTLPVSAAFQTNSLFTPSLNFGGDIQYMISCMQNDIVYLVIWYDYNSIMKIKELLKQVWDKVVDRLVIKTYTSVFVLCCILLTQVFSSTPSFMTSLQCDMPMSNCIWISRATFAV